MSGQIPLERLERIIDASGVAERIEALLPIGVRPRQLSVRTLLPGMLACLYDGRPAHLRRVHQALIVLSEQERRRLGVIAQWKGGPHLLTYRQVERTFHLIVKGPVSALDAVHVGCVLPDGTIHLLAAARYSECCDFTARVLSNVLTQGEVERYATVIRGRIRAHSWNLAVSVGDGVGSRYGRTGAVDRVGRVRARRGPTDQTIRVAAEALAARLHAARCDERPSEKTYEAKAISEVLRFIERPALSRPAPQARASGDTLVERENAERKRNRAARRRGGGYSGMSSDADGYVSVTSKTTGLSRLIIACARQEKYRPY